MRIHILSDLHVEFEDFDPADVGADVIVIAGDISTKGRCVDWAKKKFAAFSCPVLICAGNHDYYGGHFRKTLLKMAGEGNDRIRFMDCDEFILGDVRFLGATAWTDFTLTGNEPLAVMDAMILMNDFSSIRIGEKYRKLQPRDQAQRCWYTRQWLQTKLYEPFEGKTVIFTHHAPSGMSLQGTGKLSHLDASYANRWENLMGEGVDLWIHGHTHLCADYEIAGTRIVCNPRGYPSEDTGFDPRFVIDL